MIRVLHVNATMDLGGAETFLMNVYRNIDRSKIQFDFLLHTDKECYYNEEIRKLGGRIYYIPSRRNGIRKNKQALDRFFDKYSNEYKIIHQHSSSLSYIEPIKYAKKYGIQTRIIHSHNIKSAGASIHKYIHMINKCIIDKYATNYFACSDLAAKWMYKKEIINKKNYNVINNAIEIDKFKFSEEIREKKRKELNIKDKYVIGHVGRFHKQKNHDYLIDIFNEIHKKEEKSLLLLIGDGNERADIEKKVKDLGLSKSVMFMGIRGDVSELFQAMDVFLFPSLYEGLGIVLIEAQASGLKCFTSKHVVPSSVNVTGLVEFIDLDKKTKVWSDNIIKNLLYERLDTSKKIISNKYDIKKVAEDIQTWYQQNYNK